MPGDWTGPRLQTLLSVLMHCIISGSHTACLRRRRNADVNENAVSCVALSPNPPFTLSRITLFRVRCSGAREVANFRSCRLRHISADRLTEVEEATNCRVMRAKESARRDEEQLTPHAMLLLLLLRRIAYVDLRPMDGRIAPKFLIV